MRAINVLVIIVFVLFASGCKTITAKKQQIQYLEESQEVIGAIAESVTGQPLTEEEKKALQKNLKNDPETQSAVQSIANSISQPARMKYSPATGKRYAAHLKVDPETGAKLLWLDDE